MPSMLDMFDRNLEDFQTVSVPGTNFVDTAESGDFTQKLNQWVRKVVNDVTKYKVDVNKDIAIIAQQNNLNNDQIQRIIEEVNTQIYLIEYNKQRNNVERDVDFQIADLQKIKDAAGNDIKANREAVRDAKTEGEKADMPKKASLENDGDPLNFLNYTAYETCGLAEDKKITERELIQRGLEQKLASEDDEYAKECERLAIDVDSVAEALIKYARLSLDHQEIFSTMCKEANLSKSAQILIKSSVADRLTCMKENREIADKFACDIELVDGMVKEAKLSLGKHSLIKEASDTSSNKSLPTVPTNRKLIKSYKDLISLAQNIQEQQEKNQAGGPFHLDARHGDNSLKLTNNPIPEGRKKVAHPFKGGSGSPAPPPESRRDGRTFAGRPVAQIHYMMSL
jgi:LysM repeat protein